MKRKNILRLLLYAFVAFSMLISFESCASKNNLDRGKASHYSKVRTHQPDWNSTTSLNTRYKKKKNRGKHLTTKKAKHSTTAKSREYIKKD
jgi:hypothetical protein